MSSTLWDRRHEGLLPWRSNDVGHLRERRLQMTRIQRKMSALIVAGVLALGGAACEGGDDEEDDATTELNAAKAKATSVSF